MSDFREELIARLKVGMTKDELEAFLLPFKENEHLPIDTERMNQIGGLRSEGFIIPKKRGFYQIVGFEEKKFDLPADKWPDEQQEIFRRLRAKEKVRHEDYPRLRDYYRSLVHDSDFAHHFAPGYPLSYELARDTGYFVGEGGIVHQKFSSQPRFRIIAPSYEAREDFRALAQLLGRVSRTDVRLVSVSARDSWKEVGFVKHQVRDQGLYRIESLADELRFISQWSDSMRTNIRRAMKEMTIFSARQMVKQVWMKDATYVVDQWRYGRAGQKQRQLAITRDYVAIDLAHEHMSKTSFLFYRNGSPVGVAIYDTICEQAVSDLVLKGLNYKSMPGGMPNTGIGMQILAAKKLQKLGYSFINGGDIHGGEAGLTEYKLALIDKAPGSSVFKTTDWVLPDSHYTPEKM